jgi:hypothetical protein
MLIVALLSLSVGVAFASPLYFADLNIQPFPRLPSGPKAEFAVNAIYANFTVEPASPEMIIPVWYPKNETLMSLTYKIVLNITNPSEYAAALDYLDLTVAQEANLSSDAFLTNMTFSSEESYRGAWLDDQWINITWIPASGIPVPPPMCVSGILPTPSPTEDGYWREGIEICTVYTNGSLSQLFLLINGTWSDVTGHLQIPD